MQLMKKVIYILFFTLLIASKSVGQVSDNFKQVSGLYLKTNLLRPLDLVNPGVSLGVGYSTEHQNYELDYVKLYDPYTNHAVDLINGSIISAGIYRVTKKSVADRKRVELGLRVDYFSNSYTTVQNFLDFDAIPVDSSSYLAPEYLDSLAINKRMLTTNFMLRYTYIRGKLLFNIHGGIGLRYKMTDQQGRIDSEDPYGGNHYTVWDFADDDTRRWGVAFPISVSIGYYLTSNTKK